VSLCEAHLLPSPTPYDGGHADTFSPQPFGGLVTIQWSGPLAAIVAQSAIVVQAPFSLPPYSQVSVMPGGGLHGSPGFGMEAGHLELGANAASTVRLESVAAARSAPSEPPSLVALGAEVGSLGFACPHPPTITARTNAAAVREAAMDDSNQGTPPIHETHGYGQAVASIGPKTSEDRRRSKILKMRISAPPTQNFPRRMWAHALDQAGWGRFRGAVPAWCGCDLREAKPALVSVWTRIIER
jgi:hypothetical protein